MKRARIVPDNDRKLGMGLAGTLESVSHGQVGERLRIEGYTDTVSTVLRDMGLVEEYVQYAKRSSSGHFMEMFISKTGGRLPRLNGCKLPNQAFTDCFESLPFYRCLRSEVPRRNHERRVVDRERWGSPFICHNLQLQPLAVPTFLEPAYMRPPRPTVAQPVHYPPKQQHYTTVEQTDSNDRSEPCPSLAAPPPLLNHKEKPHHTTPHRQSTDMRSGSNSACAVNINSTPPTSAPSHMYAKTMPIGIEDPMQLKERHDARARRKWQELNERREVLDAQAFCRGRCVVGRRRSSPVGRKVFVGEVVWRASMVLRDVQNSPKSEFCSIFQRASMLRHVRGGLYGREGEDQPRMPLSLCRPSMAHGSALGPCGAQGIPSCCSLISPSLSSDGTLRSLSS
jgi:hypothetical protein